MRSPPKLQATRRRVSTCKHPLNFGVDTHQLVSLKICHVTSGVDVGAAEGDTPPEGAHSTLKAKLRDRAVGQVKAPKVASFAHTVHDDRPTHAASTTEKDVEAEQDAFAAKRQEDEEIVVGSPKDYGVGKKTWVWGD